MHQSEVDITTQDSDQCRSDPKDAQSTVETISNSDCRMGLSVLSSVCVLFHVTDFSFVAERWKVTFVFFSCLLDGTQVCNAADSPDRIADHR